MSCERHAVVVFAGLIAILGTLVPGFANEPTEEPPPTIQEGKVMLRVILVDANLDQKPVAKRGFLFCPAQDCAAPIAVTTSFTGEASIALAPGEYGVRSAGGVPLAGRIYSWDQALRVEAGSTVEVELSNDNAQVAEALVEQSVRAPSDEGRLYSLYKQGVFKVYSESGHGSGFLIGEEGLVLTNAHVVRDSPFLAVKVDDSRKYAASLLASDDANDVAVLRIHPDAVKGVPVLPLAEDSVALPPVSVGERVVAIGSPLTADTILTSGLISKIEEGAYFSDVSINPGNSGGPLINMTGRVIGLNTFGLPAGRGPGVSGIIRIHIAKKTIAVARERLAGSESPTARRLPVEPSFKFPATVLAEEAKKYQTRNIASYHLEAGPIDMQFMTPVLVSGLEVKAKDDQGLRHRNRNRGTPQYAHGVDFYEWQRYAGDYRAVVTVQAVPEISLTGGSAFAMIVLGANARQEYRFKTDFERMELARDGVVVEPIQPGRLPQAVDMAAGLVRMKDMTFFGTYEYPPEAFKPGAAVEVRVWHSKRKEPTIRKIAVVTLERIWGDFRAYFEALESTASAGAEGG